MARKIKKKQVDENKRILVESIKEFSKEKNFSTKEILDILKDAIGKVLKKKYGDESNFTIVISEEEGDIQIMRERVVVPDLDLEDITKEIPLSEAMDIVPDIEVGEPLMDYVDFSFFSRLEINKIKQNIINGVRRIEHKHIFEKYEPLKGTIILVEVYKEGHTLRIKKDGRERRIRGVLVKHEGQEAFLPYEELNPKEKDNLKQQHNLRVLVKDVLEEKGAPLIIVSRRDNKFVEKLFEQEVPEIADGLIVIRKIARRPGHRAKILVESLDDRIDPVGACVGVKGIRISAVVKELNNEKIDIIPYTSNIPLLIERVLRPARVNKIELLDEPTKDGLPQANVFVPAEDIKKAIGPRGENIVLASRLTGYKLNIVNEQLEEDIPITEFDDVIPEEDIKKLQEAGFSYARKILLYTPDILSEMTKIPEEKLEKYIEAIKDEFSN